MKSTQSTADAPAAGPAVATAPDPVLPDIKARVIAYLQRLRVRDPSLLESLADECLQRARKRSGDAGGQLIRQALEEARRCLDHALVRAAHMSNAQECPLLAGLRTALLLGKAGVASDALMGNSDRQAEIGASLRTALPQPVPPEAHLPMPEQTLSFLFWKSVTLHES